MRRGGAVEMAPISIIRSLTSVMILFYTKACLSIPIVLAWTASQIAPRSCAVTGTNRRSGRTICLRMDISSSEEGGKGSYEEQYAAFLKMSLEQKKTAMMTNNIIDNPSRLQEQDEDSTGISLNNARERDVGNEEQRASCSEKRRHDKVYTRIAPKINLRNEDPAVLKSIRDHGAYLRRQEPNDPFIGGSDGIYNKKTQEEVEKAFLEFISAEGSYQSKAVPPPLAVKTPISNQQDIYSDISTTLDFDLKSPQHEHLNDRNDEVNPDESLSNKMTYEDNQDDNGRDRLSETSTCVSSVTLSVDEAGATTITTTPESSLSTRSTRAEKEREINERDLTHVTNSDTDGEVPATEMISDEDSSDPFEAEYNYATIEVKIETTLPSEVSVNDARLGWLEFCWLKGGGIVVPATKQNQENNDSSDINATLTTSIRNNSTQTETDHKDEMMSIRGKDDIDIPSVRELIMPLGMRQELISSESSTNKGMHTKESSEQIQHDVITYKTTKRGFFCQDMMPSSHKGKVEFIGASYTSTRMIWTVTFQIKKENNEEEHHTILNDQGIIPVKDAVNIDDDRENGFGFVFTTKTMIEEYSKQLLDSNPGLKSVLSKENIWGSWSQFQLKTATQNLLAYLDNAVDSMPTLEHKETLPMGVSPSEAMYAWYEYYWCKGGGVLPVVTANDNSNTRWVVPSALEEEILLLEYDHPTSESLKVAIDGEIETETEISKVIYRVNNPNLFTYPVHYNRATVKFVRESDASPTQLIWRVKVQPYRKFFSGGVQFWTKNGIVLASRNLKHHLEGRQLKKRKQEIQDELRFLEEEIQGAVGEFEKSEKEIATEGDILDLLIKNDRSSDETDRDKSMNPFDVLHAFTEKETEKLFNRRCLSEQDLKDIVENVLEEDCREHLGGIEEEMLEAHEELQQLMAECSGSIAVGSSDNNSSESEERGNKPAPGVTDISSNCDSRESEYSNGSHLSNTDQKQIEPPTECPVNRDDYSLETLISDEKDELNHKDSHPSSNNQASITSHDVTRSIERPSINEDAERKNEETRSQDSLTDRHELKVDATPLVSSSIPERLDRTTQLHGPNSGVGHKRRMIRPELEIARGATSHKFESAETVNSIQFPNLREPRCRKTKYVEVGPDATLHHGSAKSVVRGSNGRKRPTITPLNEESGSMFRPRSKETELGHRKNANHTLSNGTTTIDVPSEEASDDGDKRELRP